MKIGFYNNHKAIINIVFLALFVRIVFFVIVQPWNGQVLQERILVNDAVHYHRLALSILQSGTYSYASVWPEVTGTSEIDWGAFRPPGYPIFISMLYFLFGVNPWIVFLFQLSISIGALLMLYFLARKMFSESIAIIAAFLFAIEPHVIYFSLRLASDTLFSFTFLTSIFFLIYGLTNRNLIQLLLSGFFLGLATLIRVGPEVFLFIVICMIIIYPDLKRNFRLKSIFGFFMIFLLTILPWLYRNHLQYEHLSLSSAKGFNLLFVNVAFAEVSETGHPIDQVRTDLREMAEEQGVEKKKNPFDRDQVYMKIATTYLVTNWKDYVPKHFKGMVYLLLNLNTKGFAKSLGIKPTQLPFSLSSTSNSMVVLVTSFLKTKSIYEIIIGIFIGVFLALNYSTFLFGSAAMIYQKDYINLYHRTIFFGLVWRG